MLPPSNAQTALKAAGAPANAWRATFKERVAREGGDVSLNPSAVVGKVQGMLRELKPEDRCEPPAGRNLRNFRRVGGKSDMPPPIRAILDDMMKDPYEPFALPEATKILQELQQADPETSADIAFVTKREVLPGSSEEYMSRRTTDLFMHPTHKLLMRNDCYGAADKWRTQLVIPEHPRVLRLAIIDATHADCGHGAFRNTLHHVKNSFYWHGMRNDIKAVCDGCDLCQKAKATRRNQA